MSSLPQPPNDAEAEMQVIACVLIEPGREKGIALGPEDFYDERRGEIWRAIQDVCREGHQPDYSNVAAKIESWGGDRGDVVADLSRYLTNSLVQFWNFRDYADRIKERAGRRALVKLAGEIAGAAYDTRSDLTAARARWMTDLISTYHLRDQAEQIGPAVRAVVAETEAAAKHPQEIYGIATGFVDFDHVTKGLQTGETFLLAGQPGMGKSLFAGQSLMTMALGGTAVTYYALEMKSQAMVRRMLSSESRVPTDRLRGGYVQAHEWDTLYDAAARLSDIPFYLSDATDWDTARLRADVARLKATAEIKVVAVDHDGLLTDRGYDPNERDKQISRALHSIAKDFDVAVLAVHTMNKTGLRMDAPTVGDASGSTRFVYDADVISFLTEHLPQGSEPKQPNVRTLVIAKNREGRKDVFLHFMQLQTVENGRAWGLPRLETMAEY